MEITEPLTQVQCVKSENMTIKEFRDSYHGVTDKASSLCRSTNYSLIAIVWILCKEDINNIPLYRCVFVWLLFSLTFDYLQYFLMALIGTFKYRNEEGKVKVVGEVPIKTEPEELEKIICQIVLGLFLGLTGVITTLGGFELGIFAIPIVIIAVLGSINSVNLIDGMDGLAAGIVGIASIACCAYGYLFGPMTILPPFLILAALCLGFLVFNKYPASIFMGDTGSFVLGTGYAAAVLVCDIPYFGVLALGVPIISVIVSLLHRAHIIKLPVEPLHHTLNHYGMSEVKIILTYWGCTALLCIIGILAKMYIF